MRSLDNFMTSNRLWCGYAKCVCGCGFVHLLHPNTWDNVWPYKTDEASTHRAVTHTHTDTLTHKPISFYLESPSPVHKPVLFHRRFTINLCPFVLVRAIIAIVIVVVFMVKTVHSHCRFFFGRHQSRCWIGTRIPWINIKCNISGGTRSSAHV